MFTNERKFNLDGVDGYSYCYRWIADVRAFLGNLKLHKRTNIEKYRENSK